MDLSKPFEWKSPSVVVQKKPDNVPSTEYGELFPNHPKTGEFSTFGGLYAADGSTKPNRLSSNSAISWAHKPSSSLWTQLVSVGDIVPDLWNGAATTAENTGYYIGGQAHPRSTTVMEPAYSRQLLSVTQSTWRATDLPSQLEYVQKPFFQYVPIKGKAGILLSFGGLKMASRDGSDNNPSSLLDMDKINVYDIETETWMVQKTSGEPPSGRHRGCSAAFKSEDGSSYNIYIHGGQTENTHMEKSQGTNDVWILSLPSFTWVKASSGGMPFLRLLVYLLHCPRSGLFIDPSILASDMRISLHSCVSSGRHLMAVGGILSHNVDPGKFMCAPLINVFDATSLSWVSGTVPADTSYEVPAALSAVIGGGRKGGASKLTPDGGWSTPQVGALFAAGISSETDLLTNVSTASTNSGAGKEPSGSGTSSGGSGLTIGAIVGIAVGAVAIVLCAGVTWFLVRRSKRKKTGVSYNDDEIKELSGHPGYWRPDPATVTEIGDRNSKVHTDTEMMEKIKAGLGPAEVQGDRSLSSRDGAEPAEMEGSRVELYAGAVSRGSQ